MTFELFTVGRKYGDNGWEVEKDHLSTFQRLEEALQEAGSLALLGKVVEVWVVRETWKGPERRLFAVLSWWAFERGAVAFSYDTDYLD